MLERLISYLRSIALYLKQVGWHGITMFILGLGLVIILLIDLWDFIKFKLGYH